jgi:hypothetical protein
VYTEGLEPSKIGFAGRRLDRFGIATCENPFESVLRIPVVAQVAQLRD